MNSRTCITLILAVAGLGAGTLAAQDYDDIYYNSSSKKKSSAKTSQTTTRVASNPTIVYGDYPAADTYAAEYAASTNDVRDIDEYNRRGIFAEADAVASAADEAVDVDFENTRKIEKYYNPDVVVASSDEELATLYYAEPITVNVYNIDPYWGWAGGYPRSYWGWPYGVGYWGWSGPYWSSWGWPSLAWSWGWGPGWSYSWGWNWGWSGFSWAWGGGHHGWGGYHANNPRHPNARSAAIGRGSAGSPAGGVRQGIRGASAGHSGMRSMQGTHAAVRSNGGNVRPGATSAGFRTAKGLDNPASGSTRQGVNAANGSKTAVSGGSTRKGVNTGTSTRRSSNTQRQSTTNNNATRSSNNANSFNSNSSSSRSSGFSGGSRSGGGGGGGSRGGRH